MDDVKRITEMEEILDETRQALEVSDAGNRDGYIEE